MPQELMPWDDPPAATVRTKESMPWEDSVPSVTSRVVRYDMPEPPAAPKIAALQPDAPAPPGFGQRVYEQTLQVPVELAKGLWNDPKGTLMKTLASMTATQIQAVQNPMRIQAASPVTPIIEDVRSGNLSGAAGGVTGLGLTLLTPVIAAKTPKVIRATPTAVRGAVEGGLEAARSGKTIAESGLVWTAHQVGGPKAAATVAATTTGTRVAAGAIRGARSALKARAAAAAEALAAERAAAAETAAAEAARPGPIPVERQLPPGATRMPPAADTSFVQAVPAELPEVLSPTLRSKPAAATAAEQLREEMIKSGSITPEEPTPITRQSGAEKIVEARNAKAERFVEPFQRFEFSTKDVKDFGPSEWEVFAKAIGEDIPSPDTIAQIVLRMSKRK